MPLNLQGGQEFTAHLICAKYVMLATETALHCWDLRQNTTFNYKVDQVICIKKLSSGNSKTGLSKFYC